MKPFCAIAPLRSWRELATVWALTLVLCVTVLVAAAGAGTLYVDAAATGAGSGADWANAYTRVQDALNAAVPGDVVEISGGTYAENLTTPGAGVAVIGSLAQGHSGTVTIQAVGGSPALTVSQQTTWRRLTFTSDPASSAVAYVVSVVTGNPTFEQCVIGPGFQLLSVADAGASFSRSIFKEVRDTTNAAAVNLAAASGAVTFDYCMFIDMAYRYINVRSYLTADWNNCLFAGFKGQILNVPATTTGTSAQRLRWQNCLAISNEGGHGYDDYSLINNLSNTVTVQLDHCLIQPIVPVHMTTPLYTAGVTVTNPLSGSPGLRRGRREALVNVGIDDWQNLAVWSQLVATADLYGFKTTLALNTAEVTDSDWTTMSAAVVRGHEVASHTAHHVVLSDRTKVLNVKYTGSDPATDATLTVDRTTLTLHVVVTGVTGADFDLPLGADGAYPTLTDLKNAINTHQGFKATTRTFTGTTYNTGAFLSQDLAAVQNLSVFNLQGSLNLDDTATFYDELVVPKQTIEANLPGYSCDALVYPYLEFDDATVAAATAAGYTGARTGENGTYAMGDPAGYNLMLIYALEPGQIFGSNLDETTLRARLSAVLEWAKFTGAAFGLYSHGEDEYTLEAWRTLLRIMAEDPDVEVVTLAEIARRIKADAQSVSGTTYFRTQWPDIVDYRPTTDSILLNAGAPYSVAKQDFDGQTVAAGTIPTLGLYQMTQPSPQTGKMSPAVLLELLLR